MNKCILLVLVTFSCTGIGYTKQAGCPPDPTEVVVFIDTCPTGIEDFYTTAGKGACSRSFHANQTIRSYKNAGGKKKVWLFAMDYKGTFTTAHTTWAVNYATGCGIKWINFSGGSGTRSLQEAAAIKSFIKKGGRFYAAAGNESVDIAKEPFYPAYLDEVVAVGALDCTLSSHPIASYSNYGKKVRRWACGESPDGTHRGTSFASPKVMAADEVFLDKNK